MAVLKRGDDGQYAIAEPILTPTFEKILNMTSQKAYIEEFRLLLVSTTESIAKLQHFMAKRINMPPLTDAHCGIILAGTFRRDSLSNINESSQQFGPNLFLPTGGADAVGLHESITAERDILLTEQAMGIHSKHSTKATTAIKLAPKCNSPYDVHYCLGNLNVIISSMVKISQVKSENPLIYNLIHNT